MRISCSFLASYDVDGETDERGKKQRRREHQEKEDIRDKLVILETKRLILDFMKAGIDPLIFLTSRISLLQSFPLERVKNKDTIKLINLPYKIISEWSDLTTAPGFMGKTRISSGYSSFL